MLSHLMETLLLVLIASSRNVESSTGNVAGNNGKETFLSFFAAKDSTENETKTLKRHTHKKVFPSPAPWSRKSLVLFVISRMGKIK